MATRPAACGLGVRLAEAVEAIGVLVCDAGNGRAPGNRSCLPAGISAVHRSPLRREPYVPGAGSDLPVTALAACEPDRPAAFLTIGPRT